MERPGGIIEEAVCCPCCNRFLLASPDDDIDPVKPGEEYDRDIYHKFCRPADWRPPTQRTLDRELKLQDWVVLEDGAEVEFENGVVIDMSGHEGMIIEFDNGRVHVDFQSLMEIGGPKLGWVDRSKVKPMAFVQFVKGTPVVVNRGAYRELRGEVQQISHRSTNLTIRLTGEPQAGQIITVPQEWVDIDI